MAVLVPLRRRPLRRPSTLAGLRDGIRIQASEVRRSSHITALSTLIRSGAEASPSELDRNASHRETVCHVRTDKDGSSWPERRSGPEGGQHPVAEHQGSAGANQSVVRRRTEPQCPATRTVPSHNWRPRRWARWPSACTVRVRPWLTWSAPTGRRWWAGRRCCSACRWTFRRRPPPPARPLAVDGAAAACAGRRVRRRGGGPARGGGTPGDRRRARRGARRRAQAARGARRPRRRVAGDVGRRRLSAPGMEPRRSRGRTVATLGGRRSERRGGAGVSMAVGRCGRCGSRRARLLIVGGVRAEVDGLVDLLERPGGLLVVLAAVPLGDAVDAVGGLPLGRAG